MHKELSPGLHSVLGSNHADQRLASTSAPSLALLFSSLSFHWEKKPKHRHSILLLHCDDTLFFPYFILPEIFKCLFCFTSSLWWETGFRSSFCIFFLSVIYFTIVICYLFYFSHLHPPTVYVERHNLSLGRKRDIVSVFVFQVNFNFFKVVFQNCFTIRQESKSRNQSSLLISFIISFLIYIFLGLPENCSSP